MEIRRRPNRVRGGGLCLYLDIAVRVLRVSLPQVVVEPPQQHLLHGKLEELLLLLPLLHEVDKVRTALPASTRPTSDIERRQRQHTNID